MARGLAARRGDGGRRGAQPREIASRGRRTRRAWREGRFRRGRCRRPGSCRAVIGEAVARFGRLDILVNNAGMSIRKPPENYTVEEWQQVLDANLTGAFVCCQAAHPPMKRQGGGKIINIGSMMSIFGGAYAAPYSSSKGGIVQLTQVARHRLGADNIQVNAVLPGWIDTELTRDARAAGTGAERARLGAHAGRPLGRARRSCRASPCSSAAPASDFVTGAAIPVDGGYRLGVLGCGSRRPSGCWPRSCRLHTPVCSSTALRIRDSIPRGRWRESARMSTLVRWHTAALRASCSALPDRGRTCSGNWRRWRPARRRRRTDLITKFHVLLRKPISRPRAGSLLSQSACHRDDLQNWLKCCGIFEGPGTSGRRFSQFARRTATRDETRATRCGE